MLQKVPMLSLIQILDLSLQDVIANLPRDAGAVVAFALLGLFVAFVWIGSRPKGGGGGKGRNPTGA